MFRPLINKKMGINPSRLTGYCLSSMLLAAGCLLSPLSSAVTFDNPIVEQRADPFVTRANDGYYYMTATVPEYDRLEIRRAQTIQGLADADPIVIWEAHRNGPMANHIWAPELHYVDGAWYIYFAAGSSSNSWDIRTYVLENTSGDLLNGEWTERGELQGIPDYGDTAKFALDATTFNHFGKDYLVWAQRNPDDGNNSNIYIARMSNPWTIATTPVKLSSPEYPWETQRYAVNEGASVIKHGGRLFITYSASGTGAEYRMGMLSTSIFSNMLNANSWQKSEQPVFASADFNSQFGPGHNTFTKAPDGTDVMIYHSRNYEHIDGDPLHDPNRAMHAKILTWDLLGHPQFGFPPADGSTGPLQSAATQQCMSIANDSQQPGSEVEQHLCKTKDAQMWTLHPDTTDDSYYQVKTGLNGQCLDIAWNSTADGGRAIEWPCNGSTSQQWTKQDDGSGHFSLVNRNSGKCLDIWENSYLPGASIRQYTCSGASNQLWSQP